MNLAAIQTPGVYIQELNAFPNSVVGVSTAVPAFIGYTPQASYEGKQYTNVPVRITSFADFQSFFVYLIRLCLQTRQNNTVRNTIWYRKKKHWKEAAIWKLTVVAILLFRILIPYIICTTVSGFFTRMEEV